MKIPLSEQIAAIEFALGLAEEHMQDDTRRALYAAQTTLEWVERHQAELRVLGEFPIEKIEVLTPQATGLSAIAPERDEGE
jgi:hypothetical protein